MKTANLFLELVATYRKHGWELRSALLQPATLGEFHSPEAELLNKVPVKEAKLMRCGFRVPHTTTAKPGSYGCWLKLNTRCLRRLKPMKRKKNAKM